MTRRSLTSRACVILICPPSPREKLYTELLTDPSIRRMIKLTELPLCRFFGLRPQALAAGVQGH